MAFSRRRVGIRTYTAEFRRHNGNRDSYGQPTYSTESDYTSLISDWPCEFMSVVGGEVVRGKMITEKSTHVLFGNFAAVEGVNEKDLVVVDGNRYGINSVFDPDGLRMEMRVEIRRIQQDG